LKIIWIFYVSLVSILFTGCSLKDGQESVEHTKKGMFEFDPEEVPQGSESKYDILLKMDDDELFTINSSINVKNISNESWATIPLYFIPNMFTKTNSPSLSKPATLNIEKVILDRKNIEYSLKKDTLLIPLNRKVAPKETVNINILYSFTLPENGLRFTKNDSSYYLAQWYPMVPTYRNGWNKEEFMFKGESYHTPYSDFQIEYEVPENYTVVTSSEEDKFPSENKKTINLERVKEVFIAILDNPTMIENKVGGTNLRVFGLEKNSKDYAEILETASAAFDYFQTTIGHYPYKQLDIILEELGMEYPGIVTAGSIYNKGQINTEGLKRIVVHEIAHQWFYGMVSNDSYHDPWLDEGVTDLATFLYFTEYNNLDFDFSKETKFLEEQNLTLPVNLSINEYPPKDISSYIYGKSYIMLGKLFQTNGGKEKAEEFLKNYFETYQFKEVNTEEFIRYLKFYLKIEDDSVFDGWINMD